MTSELATTRLHPDVLANACLSPGVSDFLILCGDRPMLVFHLHDSPELLPALYASFQKQLQGVEQEVMPDRLGYTTLMQSEIESVTSEVHGADAEALRDLLHDGLIFAFPLHRPGSLYSGLTFTAGRHAANDIVLRHASVSKFHAWFSLDGKRSIRLCAPPSKNGTTLNGAPSSGEETVALAPGDEVRLGTVHATVVLPGVFLNAARLAYG